MLKDGIVLVAACLVLVGGIFVYWRQSPSHALRNAVERLTAKSAGASHEPPVVPPAKTIAIPLKPKPGLAKKSPAVELAQTEIPQNPHVAETLVARQPDTSQFPTSDKISSGVRHDSITSTFGDPTLFALTSTGHRVVETFVYAKDRGRRTTVIRLEDGKVIDSYTRSEPVLPTGLSAPPRAVPPRGK